MAQISARAIRAIGVLGIVTATACTGDSAGPLSNSFPTDAASPAESLLAGGPVPTAISSIMSRPNEPAGYQRIAESPMDKLASKVSGPVPGWTGFWEYSGSGMVLEPATHLLTSSPGVLRTVFWRSLLAGRAPTTLSTWGGTQSAPKLFRKVYFTQWVKVGTTAGFQNNPVGTKFGFFSYGQTIDKARNQSFMILKGNGASSVMTAMELRFDQQNTVSRELIPNRNVSKAKVTTGAWHQVELVLETNSSAGVPDGKLKLWLDGVQIHDWSNMVYLTVGNTRKFQGYNWNPTWGGVVGVRTQTDNIWMDHLYISGAP